MLRSFFGFVVLLSTAVPPVFSTPVVHSSAHQPSIWQFYLVMIPLFLLIFYLSQRPQAKRAKEQKAMLSNHKVGDEVATLGGVGGKVEKLIDDQYVVLKTGQAGTLCFQKRAVASVFPKGSVDFID